MLYRFGHCELASERFELRRSGAPVEVQPLVLRLLLYLVVHRDRLVTHGELLDALWRGEAGLDALARATHKARSAVEDDGDAQRIVRTVRGKGLRWVAAVDEQPEDRRAPAPSAPVVLYERDAELERLAGHLDAAGSWPLPVAWVSGEPGMGKTALVAAAAAAARERGFLVCRADALPDGGTTGFQICSQILAALRASRSDPLAAEGPPSPAPEGPDRFQIFRELADTAERVSHTTPLLLLLEDLHWADPDSLLGLEFLLRHQRAIRGALIATSRPGEIDADSPAAALLLEMARSGALLEVGLAPLSLVAIGCWAQAALGTAPSGRLVEDLHRRTAGNPLLVGQLLEVLAAGGAGASAAEQLEGLPLGSRAVLEQSLRRLSPPARAVLSAAALVRGELHVELLARVCELSPPEVERALADAEQARLLTADPEPEGPLRFAHELARETVLGQLSDLGRRGLHRALGEALEALRGEDATDPELAYHFLESLPLGDPERALDHAERAGRAALVRGDYTRARQLLTRACELAEALPGVGAERRYELVLASSRALVGSEHQREAERALHRAVSLARQLCDPERLARAAAGLGFPPGLVPREESAASILAKAIAGLGPEPSALRAMLLAQRAAWLGDDAHRDESLALLRRAEDEAKAVGDRQARANVLFARLPLHRRFGLPDVEDRLADAGELLRLARAGGSVPREAYARELRLTQLLECGDLLEADAEADVLQQLVEPFGVRQLNLQVYAAARALTRGNLARAEEHLAELETARMRLGAERWGALRASLTYAVRCEQGRLAEMLPHASGAERLLPGLGLIPAAHAHALSEVRRPEEAVARLDAQGIEGLRALAHQESGRAAAFLWAEVCGRHGLAKPAAVLETLLAPHAGSWCVVGPIGALLGPFALALGHLARAQGRLGEARGHFEAARESAVEADAPLFAIRAELGLARALRRRGREGDRERVRALLDRVREQARRLQLPRLEAVAGRRRSARP